MTGRGRGRSNRARAACGVAVAALGAMVSATGIGADQEPEPGAVPAAAALAPVVVRQVRSLDSRPEVAVDSLDRPHVFWAEGPEPAPGRADRISAAILEEGRWRGPEVLFRKSRPSPFLKSPVAAAVPEGSMLLCWSDWLGLDCSRAEPRSGSGLAWSRSRRVTELPALDQLDLAVAADGRAYLAAAALGAAAGGDGRLVVLASPDGGRTWREPSTIVRPEDPAVEVAGKPRIAIAPDGAVHLVWSGYRAPRWTGAEVWHVRSLDGGRSWSAPHRVDALGPEERWADAPSIAATPDGTLHLVYVCSANPGRCYRTSEDGGATWSVRERLFVGYESLAGWDQLLAAPDGTLHLVAQLREPMTVYHARRRPGGEWEGPWPLYLQPAFGDAHRPSAALSAGGTLHAVWERESPRADIVYGALDLSERPPAIARVPGPLRERRPVSGALLLVAAAAAAAGAVVVGRRTADRCG